MRRVIVITCAAILAASLPGAVVAQGVNVTGKWVFNVETSGGSGTPTVTFKQDGERVTGHYSSQTLGEADFTGTIKGNAIHFTFNANAQGQEVDVVYDGIVEKDTMKGNVAIAGGQLSGTFTGKKQ
jgi:hypothetical protein